MPTNTAPSPRQRDVLDFIAKHQAEKGFPPTIAEIAQALGVTANAVQEKVGVLRWKGWLSSDRRARTLRILKPWPEQAVSRCTVPAYPAASLLTEGRSVSPPSGACSGEGASSTSGVAQQAERRVHTPEAARSTRAPASNLWAECPAA